MRYLRHVAAIAAGMTVLSCSGNDQSQESAETSVSAATAEPVVAVDASLASQGEELFTTRACRSCHSIGQGRIVGPDLAGVTDRRTNHWIVSMITKPDSMLRADSTARSLFATYMTPMPNQNVTAEEAAALLAYLDSAGGQSQ